MWCRFPYVEDGDKPGPKPRPAIVKRVSSDQDGNPWVHVAYGTSQDTQRRDLDSFTVSNLAEMDFCGLHLATRFVLSRVALVPWAEQFFPDAPSRTSPVMGRLSEHASALLRYQGGLIARRDAARRSPRLPLGNGDEGDAD